MAIGENTNNRRILHHLFIKSNEYIENCYFITSAVCRFAEMHPKCPPQVLEIVRDFKFEKYFDEYLNELTKEKITNFEFPSSVRLPFKILLDLAKTIATQYMMPLLASNEMFNGEMEKLIFSRSISRLGQYNDADSEVTNRLLNGTAARPESDDAIEIENIVNGSNKNNIQMKISADGYVVIDHEETERLRKEREDDDKKNKIIVDIQHHEQPQPAASPSSGRRSRDSSSSSSSGIGSCAAYEMEITSEEFAEIDGLKVYEECSDIESISADDDADEDADDDDSDNYDEGYYEITNTNKNKIPSILEEVNEDDEDNTIEEFIIEETAAAAAANENNIKDDNDNDDDDNVVVNENFIAQEVVILNSHISPMNIKLNSIEKNDADINDDDDKEEEEEEKKVDEEHRDVENVVDINNKAIASSFSMSTTLDDNNKTTTTSDEEEEENNELEPASDEDDEFDMFGLPVLKNDNRNKYDEDFYREMRKSYNIM